MSNPALIEAISFLSEGIILADGNDLPHLASLHESLATVEKLTVEIGDGSLSRAAKVSADGLERIMLRDVQDIPAELASIAKTIALIQAVVIDGRALNDVDLAQATSAALPGNDQCKAGSHGESAAEQTDAETTSAPESREITLSGDLTLTAEFVTEGQEHLDAANVHLLTIESNPSDSESLNAVFRAFHTIKGVAGFLELTPIQVLAHETETMLDKCRKGELILAGDALDVVFEATDVMKQLVTSVAEALSGDLLIPAHPALPKLVPRIKAVTAGKSDVATAKPSASEATRKITPATNSTEQSIATVPARAESVVAQAPHVESQDKSSGEPVIADGKKPTTMAVKDTVRVDAERLDKLVDTIGEMVIAEAMVSQASEWDTRGSSPVSRLLNHLGKITRELQELAMSMRMVPVRSSFQRMARLARDVSKKLGKPVDFVTVGEETELDKNVVDAIGDPLVHMVRNAIDHGLEDGPEARKQAGKPEVGRVELRAFHKGGSIYIEIEDDGRGLDRDRILAKAIERGLIQDGESLTDSEVFNLVFEPGFSTAKTITDVSGRGVGLDVVKKGIQALRGKTEIRSELGKGTVFSIRLPLTLAIIEGMVVRVMDQRYIIPTLSIVRMIRPGESDLSTVFAKGEMLKLGVRLVPLYHLDKLFGIEGAIQDPCEAAVVVVEHDNRQIAFLADELLGQQQIVIKPLGLQLRKYSGFTGGAIMPDGRVGLILDVAGLTDMAGSEGKALKAA